MIILPNRYMKSRPYWITKYTELGFDKDWLDSVIDEYNSDLIDKTTEDYSPLKFIDIDILNINSRTEIISHLDIPDTYPLVTILSFVYDVIDEFSHNIPSQDDQIYELYTDICGSSEFYSNFEFSDFYIFCRKLNDINIHRTRAYTIIHEAKDRYTYDKYPIPESKWNIVFNNINMTVKIVDEVQKINNNVIDPYMIVEVLDSEDTEYTGKSIQLEPYHFNEGEMVV